ncbi:MAG: B12-binding domain-containing radical SAM protein [Bacteroidetes bacterium]|nr:B12-binding domain-containing radical SAM protein [Bacteroidota bacterium]
MKVLFTHSYFLHFDNKQLKTRTPFPPLATLYAASVLMENGYEVKLADLQFSSSSDEITQHIEQFKPDVFVIYDDSFNYLTKMCLTNMREAAFRMQKIAKEKNIPVIVSSSDATDHLEKYFSNGANYIIIGEAEQTLLEIVNGIKKKNNFDPATINGLAYSIENKIVKTSPRLVLKDLDHLPLPAWDLIDITQYKKTWMDGHGYFSINFVTTRGCPYKCNWCAKPIYGNRYNSHSPQNIAEQIKTLQAKFGFTHIWFADDIFGLKPNWLKEFSTAMNEKNIKIKYKIQSRADLLLEDENIKYLAESGCDEVWIGAESGSQKVLDAMDKGTTIEQIKEATALLKKHHIKPCFFLQFGYTGELIEDIGKTVLMVEELKPHDIGISVSYPLPGTKFYDKVKQDLVEKQNWKDSDDLHLMFKSTYRSDFYRYLQRFVHYKFRKTQALHLYKTNTFNKRMVLGPYYYLKQIDLKKKLVKLEPEATKYL